MFKLATVFFPSSSSSLRLYRGTREAMANDEYRREKKKEEKKITRAKKHRRMGKNDIDHSPELGLQLLKSVEDPARKRERIIEYIRYICIRNVMI